MDTSNDDPGTTKRPGRARSRTWRRPVAGILLVVAFTYATIYGCGTFLIEGIDPNTKPERFTGPRPDIPITQARADTLNLLLTIYDTLTRDHIIDAWVPPAPGPGGGGYQARIGSEYDQPVCPEGTTNEIYALAEATETTPGSLHSEHAVILIGQAATSHGFTKDAGYGDYRRLTDGAQIDFSNSQAVRITTGCHPGTPFQDWPTGTEAIPDFLRTTGHNLNRDTSTDTWPTQTPTNPIPSPATDQPPPQATPPQATPTPTKTPRPRTTP